MRTLLLSLAGFALLLGAGAQAQTREQTTTDGRPPIICAHGALVTGMLCEGSYCDDVTLRCGANVREVRSTYWTNFVHRPGGAGRATCGDRFSSSGVRGFMSGIACEGDWCDNVALQCTELELFEPDWTTCHFSGWFSEEERHGWQTWPSPFHFVVALTCRGAHCDEKRLQTCRLKRRAPE